MTILGVALDMDGLLFDTERLYWQVGDTVLQRRGYRFSHELQQRMMGRVGTAAMQQMIEMHQLDDEPAALLAEAEEVFDKMIGTPVEKMPGVDRFVRLLQEIGLPFGLATSSRRKFVDVLFEEIQWRDELAFILTGDDVTRGKPDPQMYQMAAEALSVPPANMLVLEDSGNGCTAAVTAGAITVAVPSEFTRTQPFHGAELIADTLNDPRLHQLVRSRSAV